MAKLYYYSNSSSDWNLASNWWFNSNHTTPAGRKPTSADDIIILADSVEPLHPYIHYLDNG